MEENWRFNLEDLLSETRQIINEVEGEIELGEEDTINENKPEENQTRRKELKNLENDYALRVNGYLNIRIESTKMIAHADFIPPSLDGEEINQEKTESSLAKKNIIFGIDWIEINKAIEMCNRERVRINDRVIARGESPKDEVSPHFEVIQEIVNVEKNVETPALKPSDRVNYKEVNPFILLKARQKAAVLVGKTPGIMGQNICGTMIPFKKADFKFPKPGKNIYVNDTGAFASCAGRLHVDSRSFWIEKVLEIPSDVDYST